MTPNHAEIIRAYRHLYQHLLRVCKYTKPSRYVARDRIRVAFRNQPAERFDPVRVARTLEFLDNAAKNQGMEHSISRNWTHVWYERQILMTRNHPG